jgi:hypothetical protein
VIRSDFLEQLNVSKEEEEQKAKAGVKSHEKRLLKEIEDDHNKFLAKYRAEIQKDLNNQVPA